MDKCQTYSIEEAREECLKYFDGDKLAADTMINKYLLRNKKGELLECSPNQLINRCAEEFHRIESKYANPVSLESIKDALNGFKRIVPQGSPLAGIGNRNQIVSLSNCFVIGQPIDSWGGICRKDEELAQIEKRRGGVGIDLSTLRPAKSLVNNAAVTSDGVVCFAQKYSNTSEGVAQGGRRGALMLSLSCRHPDIEQFIECKRDLKKVTGANISVKWTNDFLESVRDDKEYVLRFPVDADPSEALMTETVKARKVWDKFVEAAHASGEPGCIFWDNMVKGSISDCYDVERHIVTTNPCGELPLPSMGACVLMLMNLVGYVDHPYTSKAKFNSSLFHKDVRLATRLIDDLVDLEIEKVKIVISKIKSDKEPDEIKNVELNVWKTILKRHEDDRRVGLGVTGLADCLAMLGIRYGSAEAMKEIEVIFKSFHTYNMIEQCELAKERGSFKGWKYDLEKDNPHLTILSKEVKTEIEKYGRRNISTTTCAPAGTISIITRTSSGVEPVFEVEYHRRSKMTPEEEVKGVKPSNIDASGVKWKEYVVVHRGQQEWKKSNPDKKIEESPYHGCDARRLDWRGRVKTQAVIQKYITSSISSTINMPKSSTIKDVNDAYIMAWEEGCKGITVYRDGSRENILSTGAKTEDIIETSAPKRPNVLSCDIHYSTIEKNNWAFFVGLLNGRPYDIFGGKKINVEIPKKFKNGWIKKNGKNERGVSTYDLYLGSLEESEDRMIIHDIASVFQPDTGSYTRMISAMLRHGIPIKFICEQLHKDSEETSMFTFEKGVARVLKKYIKDGEKATGLCLSCKSVNLQYRDGCVYCADCGYSKCS